MKIIEIEYEWALELSRRRGTYGIILHHAAAETCSAEDIHRWHLNNGWAGIGYHFVVRKDGKVYRGRPIDAVGAHTYGRNTDCIGICFEGNFENEEMPEVQKNAGIELVSWLLEIYPEITEITKHMDHNATACPGKNFPFEEIAAAEPKKEPEKEEKMKGALELYAEPLYISSTATQRAGMVTGTYYLWSNEVIRGRVKITNMPENIGKAGQVTGWISAEAAETGSTIHPVLWGDTLSAIAKKYGSTVEKIVNANKAKYPNITADYIVAGWTLVIPR